MKTVTRKKLFLWLSSALVVFSLFISNVIFFSISDTEYEKFLRSFISQTIRQASSLDSNEFEQPVVANQTFLIPDSLIAMSGKLVYRQNEKIEIYFRSPQNGELELSSVTAEGETHLQTLNISQNSDSGWLTVNSLTGFDLSIFSKIEINPPQNFSGWLQATITTGNQIRNIPIFIDSSWASETSKLETKALFVESTNTFKAYVSANGLRNNYSNPYHLTGHFSRPFSYPMDYELLSPTANTESFVNGKRPKGSDLSGLSCSDHLANANFALKYSLQEAGVQFDLASDDSLGIFPVPDKYKLLIFGAHQEYWSTGMFEHVHEFVQKGGSVLFMGGNNAWRFVEQSDQGFEIYWGNGAQTSEQKTFVNEILGTYWDMRGYNTFAPLKTATEITGFSESLNPGIKFGENLLLAHCDNQIAGFSGSETDKLLTSSNKNFKVLASGLNPWQGGAQIVSRKTEFGGYLLNFSSTGTWLGIEDSIYKKILSSYLQKVDVN